MGRDETEISHLRPQFSEENEFAADFAALVGWIELAEWNLRQGEYAPIGHVDSAGQKYTIRVNGNEDHEAPHVHITLGNRVEVRVFLDRETRVVAPDQPQFNKAIRNKETRAAILDFVVRRIPDVLRAWTAAGNHLHYELTAVPPTGQSAAAKFGNSRAGANLNAHLDEE
jgi:hypothetical protein